MPHLSPASVRRITCLWSVFTAVAAILVSLYLTQVATEHFCAPLPLLGDSHHPVRANATQWQQWYCGPALTEAPEPYDMVRSPEFGG